ncbi:MAG: hypothetical protein LBB50_04350, partial [Oscillospiraceae bacterium]|nr:hypothetical protein [Oscillospiraceae bacterium]
MQTNAVAPPKLTLPQRAVFLVLGTGCIAVAIGIFLFCRFGTDPSVTLYQGISAALRLPFTGALLLVNLPITIACLVFHRNLIGVGSVANMVLVGPLAQFLQNFLLRHWPLAGLAGRAALFAAGVVLLSVGLTMYIASNLGLPPVDTVSVMIAQHVKLQFRWVRIAQDVTAIVMGVGLGLL